MAEILPAMLITWETELNSSLNPNVGDYLKLLNAEQKLVTEEQGVITVRWIDPTETTE
jgi:hypothetical protein